MPKKTMPATYRTDTITRNPFAMKAFNDSRSAHALETAVLALQHFGVWDVRVTHKVQQDPRVLAIVKELSSLQAEYRSRINFPQRKRKK